MGAAAAAVVSQQQQMQGVSGLPVGPPPLAMMPKLRVPAGEMPITPSGSGSNLVVGSSGIMPPPPPSSGQQQSLSQAANNNSTASPRGSRQGMVDMAPTSMDQGQQPPQGRRGSLRLQSRNMIGSSGGNSQGPSLAVGMSSSGAVVSQTSGGAGNSSMDLSSRGAQNASNSRSSGLI
jgi:hypothetical protein